MRRGADLAVLSLAFALSALVVTVGLLAWFSVELHGSHRGMAERGAALAEVVWPLVVAIGAPHARLERRLAPTWAPRAT
jgi:hypothetical protein